MAWPDTADFPENWEGLIGYDGTDYTGTWVLDTTVVPPGKAASLRTNPGPNGWCAIKTPLFTYQNPVGGGWSGSVNFQWRHSAVRSPSQKVFLAFFHEDGRLVDSSWTFYEGLAANEWHSLSYVISNSRLVHGERYFIVLCARFPGIDYWISGFQLYYSTGGVPPYSVAYSFDADTAPDIIRIPALPLAQSGDQDAWPGPLDSYYGLPTGWSIDYASLTEIFSEPWLNAIPNPVPGSNGVGTSLPIAFTASFEDEALNNALPGVYHDGDLCVVSAEVPANSEVSFDYLNGIIMDAYVSNGGPFSYDDEYLDDFSDYTIGGWERTKYTVGDQPVHLVFYAPNFRSPTLSYSLFGPYYTSAIDNFFVQPLTVSDGEATDEVGMVVGGVFRWEPSVMVEDSAAAAEAVMGVPYTGWLTDPEWPIWHAGSPTYLPGTDPGTAWDFLDDVAYGDQDYGVGVSGTVVFQNSASLDDLATITDELDALNEPVLEGRAIAFDQHEPLTMGPSLAVLADGDELASLSVVASLIIDQGVQAVEVPTLQFTATVEDVAAADEVVTGTTAQVEVSAGVADQDVIPGAAVDLLVVEDSQAVELAEPGAAALAEDEADGFEDATPAAVLPLLVSEAEALSELEDQADAPPAVLEGMAGATDELLAQVTSAAALESTAVAEDLALYAQPGAVALVMNTETAAVSWYENWQFTDMAQVGNTVLAIGPEGLAVLGGNTDAGDRINASLAWGYRDFGNEQKKRVDSFWFGYSATGLLQVGVQTFGQGYGRFVYRMENRQATKGRNNRVTPGKGLNARYWKVDISNVAGCAFDVDSMGVELLNSTRRI